VYAILGKVWLTGARELPKPPEVAAVSKSHLFKLSSQRHDWFESRPQRIHVSLACNRLLINNTDVVLVRNKTYQLNITGSTVQNGSVHYDAADYSRW